MRGVFYRYCRAELSSFAMTIMQESNELQRPVHEDSQDSYPPNSPARTSRTAYISSRLPSTGKTRTGLQYPMDTLWIQQMPHSSTCTRKARACVAGGGALTTKIAVFEDTQKSTVCRSILVSCSSWSVSPTPLLCVSDGAIPAPLPPRSKNDLCQVLLCVRKFER